MNCEEILLRTLAWEYACAAHNEKNIQARALHTAVNDLKMIRPVVLIEEIPFHELNFDGSLTLLCEDPDLRGAEDWFRRQLFKWKHFPADMILPPYLRFHSHARSRKPSRPRSSLVSPSSFMAATTLASVAMEAWSVPGTQRAA